jgi:hypothetical protein
MNVIQKMIKRRTFAALEKNILKYRAIQMILLLHQVESLKSFVLGSIRSTDRLVLEEKQRLPDGTKKLFIKVWAILVNEGIITKEESEDIQNIVEIRNEIGHSIHNLVLDISGPEFVLKGKKAYDYFALDRFEKYRTKIERGMNRKFILEVGFRELAFEKAEKAYKEELLRLRKRIERQYEIRRQKYSKKQTV